MIGIIGFLMSVLAMLWARKKDIIGFLEDHESYKIIHERILFPENAFKNRMSGLLKLMDRFLDTGPRFYFSIFMICLLYTSASFIFSMRFDSSKNLFFENYISEFHIGITTSIMIISSILIIVIGRTRVKTLEKFDLYRTRVTGAKGRLDTLNRRSKIHFWSVLAAVLYTSSMHLTYGSLTLTFFSAFVSLLATANNKSLYPNSAIGGHLIAVFAGASLGTLGLISVSFSFAATTLGDDTIFLGILLSIGSGMVAMLSAIDHSVYASQYFPNRWSHRQISPAFKKLAALGRASLYVAFYCVRCPGQFCVTVSIILLDVVFLRQFLPDTVVSAVSITLACFVFFSGATSLAGAGFFAFFIMSLVGVFMVLHPTYMFTTWAASSFLWILFPLVNSALDAMRWKLVKNNIRSFVRTGRLMRSANFLLDLSISIFCYAGFVFFVFFSVRMFNSWSMYRGYPARFPDGKYLDRLQIDPDGGGAWLYAMAFMIFLPTIIQYIILLFSGFTELFPKSYRNGIYGRLVVTDTQYNRDSIAWEISMVDVLGRVIFTLAVILISFTLLQELKPLFELITVKSALYGFNMGNTFASWFFNFP